MIIHKTDLPLAIVNYDGAEGGNILSRCANALKGLGYSVAGVIQTDVQRSGQRKCDMYLQDISTGRTLRISQFRGNEARGCRLDHAALAEAMALVENAVTAGPQLLVLNKFGKEEAHGRGFLPLMAEALSRGIPVLTGVNEPNRAACETLLCGSWAALKPDEFEIVQWCKNAIKAQNPHSATSTRHGSDQQSELC